MRIKLLFLALFSIVALLSGCVGLKHYRSKSEVCVYPAVETTSSQREDGPPPNCHQDDDGRLIDTVESHTGYKLGVVEFDDQGWLYGPSGRLQMLTVMKSLDEEAATGRPLTLMVFVHGWKHSAQHGDRNLIDFRTMLKKIQDDSPGRNVFGIYVGWRGLSVWPSLASTTLIDRRYAAEHVAKGSVRELFARLNRFQAKEQKKQLDLVSVVMGHSFGGLIVFNSLSQLLLDQAVDPDQLIASTPPRKVAPYFDLTILINPAFEASRYEPLHQVAECRAFPEGQTPVFVSMTSENDTATGFWFHTFRRIATIGAKYYAPKDESEKEKDNKNNKNKTHRELEEEANRNTIGYVERYRTHSLFLERNVPKQMVEYESHFRCANVCSSLVLPVGRPPPNRPETIIDPDGTDRLVLIHEPRENCDAHNPFWVVKVDKEILNGHDGFTTEGFRDFVVSLMVRKIEERKGSSSQKSD